MNKINIPADIFYVDLSKQHWVTGRRSYKHVAKDYWLLAAVIILLSLLSIKAINLAVREFRLASMETTTADARVGDCRESGGKASRCTLRYDWEINGMSHSAEDSCHRCSESPIGSAIKITYAVSDPSVSRTGGSEFDWWALAPFGIFFLPYLWVLISSFFSKDKEEGLKKPGTQLLFGKITKTRGTWSERTGKKKYFIVISYRFLSPTGARLESRQFAMRNDLTVLPVVGSPVAILYEDDDFFYAI